MDREKVIKILLVTTELRPGGAEKCLSNLACSLDKTRFQPVVVSIRSAPPPSEQKLIDLLDKHQVPVHFLDCNSSFASFRAVNKLKKIIREEEIDLIQSFLFHANVLCGIAVKQFPAVHLFTGIRVAEPKRSRHLIERWFTSDATKIVCVSESVRVFAKDVMGLPENKLVAIPNGLTTPNTDADFEPESLGIKKPYFAFVGRLEKQKGLTQFLSALRQQTSTPSDFEIVFVGQGSALGDLERLAKDMPQACHFVGWHQSPQDIMKHAVAVLLPSLWEGMPNVLLEAMSLGIPVLAFNVDGVGEIVPHDDSQLIEPGDYDSFLKKMAQLHTDQTLVSETGQKNAEWIEKNFSLKKMIASYEAIYLATLNIPN